MDLFKNNVAAGVGLAFAATVLAPILMPAMGRIGRPLAKSLVRGAMMMVDKGREVIAVAGESVEDIMAEVRAENAMSTSAPAESQAPPFATSAAPTAQTSPGAPGAPPAQAASGYSGNGASHGSNGAAPDRPAPDGATGTEAGNI